MDNAHLPHLQEFSVTPNNPQLLVVENGTLVQTGKYFFEGIYLHHH
jgi:hypothetical protein